MNRELPFPAIDEIELEDKKLVYLVVEDNETSVYPKVIGIFEEKEYEQAKANAVENGRSVIGVIMNKKIDLEEIGYVED